MSYKFKVGKTYLTQRGEAVRVVLRHAELRGYETVLGDDGAHRYDRSTHDSDAGRCTGTAHDYSDLDNFVRPPQEVRMVPLTITEEMHVAAVRTAMRCTGNDDFPRRVWRAMVEAVPTARSVEGMEPPPTRFRPCQHCDAPPGTTHAQSCPTRGGPEPFVPGYCGMPGCADCEKHKAAHGVAACPAPLTDEKAMRVVINACDSLNITRVHELGGKTRTICDEAGLLEIVRAVEAAHGIAGVAVLGEGRPPTVQEDRFLSRAVREASTLVAPGKLADGVAGAVFRAEIDPNVHDAVPRAPGVKEGGDAQP